MRINISVLKNVHLKTPRFILRDLKTEDVGPHYLNWFQDPETQKHISASAHSQEIENIRQYVLEKKNDALTMFLGIFTQEGKHIGNIKFNMNSPQNDYTIMGILIGDSEFRGQGVAPEALSVSGEYLRRHGFKKIYLGVKKDHTAAIRAYEKIGFYIVLDSPIPMSSDGQVMVWVL